jgi:hypothetical protein
MKSEDRNAIIGLVIIMPLIVAVSLEAIVMYNLYLQADKVECNLLWCIFTTEGRIVEITTNITQTCYINDNKVPCVNELNLSDIVKNIGVG